MSIYKEKYGDAEKLAGAIGSDVDSGLHNFISPKMTKLTPKQIKEAVHEANQDQKDLMNKPTKTKRKKQFKIKLPQGWRIGQFLFNFMEWLKVEKGYAPNQTPRLADTFHIPDDLLEEFYEEFLEEHTKK